MIDFTLMDLSGGSLFTQAEIGFQRLADRLRTGYSVYLPQQECSGITDPIELFEICIWGLDGASMVLVILELMLIQAVVLKLAMLFKGLPIVGLRTDFRGSGEHMGVNLMLTQSCVHLLLTTSTSG